MSQNNNCCSAGFDLIGLSSSLAILISQNVNDEDLSILSAFFTTLGDNLALIATSRATCESKADANQAEKSSNLSESFCNFNNEF